MCEISRTHKDIYDCFRIMFDVFGQTPTSNLFHLYPPRYSWRSMRSVWNPPRSTGKSGQGSLACHYVGLGKTIEITSWVLYVSVPFPFPSPFLCYVSCANGVLRQKIMPRADKNMRPVIPTKYWAWLEENRSQSYLLVMPTTP